MTMSFMAPATLDGVEPELKVYAEEQETTEATPPFDPDEVTVEIVEPVAEEPIDEEQPETDAPEAEAKDDTFFEEIKLLGQLATAERKRREAQATVDSLKDELKDARETLKFCETTLHEVASEITDLMAGKKVPKSDEPAADEPQSEEQSDDAWRAISTRELLTGMKGLGAKKLDAIVDLAPTVGQLEDLRAEASVAFKSFKEMLPKGCGQSIADAIEDKLLDVQKEHAPPASEQVEPRVESHPFFVLHAEIKEQSETENWTLADCEIADDDPAMLINGMQTFESGLDWAEGFPNEGNESDLRYWVTGWVLAQTKERLLIEKEKSEEVTAEEYEDVQDEPEEDPLASL